MARKKDVKVDGLGAWDKYANKDAAKALAEIYEHAQKASQAAREWYWRSIVPKRNASFGIRMASFSLLVCGAALPILAALSSEPATRLGLTQIGVAALAIAGLLQAGDRIFGWSSGWLRYMSTVMAMEATTRKFELDWAAHMIDRTGALTDGDKRPLFDLAKQFMDDIAKLQNDETEKWVAEFNSSLALLSGLIKSQRESTEKAAEAARAALTARESAAVAREKAQAPGSIEVSLLHKANPVEVKVRMDDEPEAAFTGSTWSRLRVAPGHHVVQVIASAPERMIQRVVDVPPGGIGRADVELS